MGLNIFVNVFFVASFLIYGYQSDKLLSKEATVKFESVAKTETIKAGSTELKGVIDKELNKVAFSLNNVSFEGFNSPLQKTHFNEHYLETSKFPKSYFSGVIIEKIDFDEALISDTVHIKGMLSIHGIEKSRIITAYIFKKNDKIDFTSDFSVLLEDHEIFVPRILNNAIATKVDVTVNAKF